MQHRKYPQIFGHLLIVFVVFIKREIKKSRFFVQNRFAGLEGS
jgi:hypothetical protein